MRIYQKKKKVSRRKKFIYNHLIIVDYTIFIIIIIIFLSHFQRPAMFINIYKFINLITLLICRPFNPFCSTFPLNLLAIQTQNNKSFLLSSFVSFLLLFKKCSFYFVSPKPKSANKNLCFNLLKKNVKDNFFYFL